ASANATLGNLISERIKNEQLWKQTDNASAVNLPQFLSNSVIETLRAKRKELSTDYQEKLETFKPSYPAMVQIKSKIDEIDRQISAEIKTIKDSLKASYETSLQQETEMKGRIESLRTELLDLQKRSIQYNILKREVDTNRSLYDGLLQRFKEVDVAGGVGANNVFIVDKPLLPHLPTSPNLVRIILLSLALGIGLSLASAYILEKMDQTIYSADQVEEISGLPMLGIIPKVPSNINEEIDHPRSAISESYRSLCTALQFASETGLPKSLLITSSGQGEGKSFKAMTIAKHFANLGLKVLLIDGDLRRPSLHLKLDTNNDVGLTNYLTGTCTPPETFQKTDIPNLAFMASGPLPPNAADLISSPRFLSLMTRGGEIFNLIVIDGPPVLGLADAPLLSNATAATIFVTAARQTKASMLRGAVRRLQMARAFIAGTVLTKFDALAAGYGYGYGYGYGGYGNSYGGYGYGHYGQYGQSPLPPSEQPQISNLQST
ncbi:MAG: polysaccharide biosynthesis tyrosine autokinase, partial [Hyphomicrobium sp.]